MTRPEPRLSHPALRHGFALVELLVALVVGAVVMLGGRLMLDGIDDSARRLTQATQHVDGDANAERMLRRSVASLQTGIDRSTYFGGDERAARFTSWCDAAGGWQERCIVTLSITTAAHGGAVRSAMGDELLLALGDSRPLPVRTGFTHGALRYLVDAHDGGSWVRSWEPGLSTPLAIAAIVDLDTLLFRVGTP